MSNDPVLDKLEEELGRAIFAWWSRLEENVGAPPTEETVVRSLTAIVRPLYLPPEQRPDGTIDLAVRRAKIRGEPLPEEPLPPVTFEHRLDAADVVDQDRIDRLVATMGANAGAIVSEAIRRGIASLESEYGLKD
jgi:hypothetical protein